MKHSVFHTVAANQEKIELVTVCTPLVCLLLPVGRFHGFKHFVRDFNECIFFEPWVNIRKLIVVITISSVSFLCWCG